MRVDTSLTFVTLTEMREDISQDITTPKEVASIEKGSPLKKGEKGRIIESSKRSMNTIETSIGRRREIKRSRKDRKEGKKGVRLKDGTVHHQKVVPLLLRESMKSRNVNRLR